jgi:hypothetical protein
MNQTPDSIKDVTNVFVENKQALCKASKAIGAILIRYKNGRYTFGSAFRVGPQIWETASHNREPEFETNIEVRDMYIILNSNLPFTTTSTFDDMLRQLKHHQCYPFEYDCRTARLRNQADVSKQATAFVYVHVPTDNNEEDIMIPSASDLVENQAIGLFGYHLPTSQQMINQMFGDNSYTYEQVLHLFNGFNTKSVSPGHIGRIGDNYFAHICSSLDGGYGSVVGNLAEPVYYVGCHIGRYLKNNIAVSVHHPVHVIEYYVRVFSQLNEAQKIKAMPYLKRHKSLLNEYGMNAERTVED